MLSVLAFTVSCSKNKSAGSAAEVATAPKSEFVVNACIASEPETIDPNLSSSVDASIYSHHMFENLMKYEMTNEYVDGSKNMRETEVSYGQAKSYEISDDLTIYTFKLRDDIYWSDGKPVTANDFEYSWKRLVDPATAADYGYFLNDIVLNATAIQNGEKDKETLGVRAIDDKTLKITLETPCAYFIEMCAFAGLMPLRQDIVEGNPNWTNPENIVCNGPYKLTEWVHDSKIVMEKNDKYYNYAKLGPDKINFYLSDSETAIISAYQAGEWQFIEEFPTDMIEALQASGDCWIDPYVGTYFLYLNCSKITDWRVRAAMTLSVDRENIVENVTQAGEQPATGFVASGILDSRGDNFAYGVSELGAIYNTLSKKYPEYDLSSYIGRCELAQKLYAEAVADGSWNPNTTIVYNFNTNESHKKIAEACGSDWQTVLGLNITLQNQEWATYTNGLGEHLFGVARLGWIADYNDPITYLELMVSSNSYNYGLFSNKEFDSAITKAKAKLANEERDALLYSAEETLFGEGGFPVCPIYYYTNKYCSKGLQNMGYTPMGYYFFMYAQPK